MSTKKKKKRWTRFRHVLVRNIAAIILTPYIKIKYKITVDKHLVDKKRQYLILFNHQTPFDQFFVGMAFGGAVYYMASEDIFSNGFISKLIKYLVAPIPIKKQTADVRAVLNCMKVAGEGGTIAIAPEGNRTYSGVTGYMNPAIVPLVKKLQLPLALYRLEGGYCKQPRWADKVRGGKMRATVALVIEPNEYGAMADEELYEAIKSELYVNESKVEGVYKSPHSAEYLERAIYTCPFCGLTELESHGRIVECKKCGRRVSYTDTNELVGVGFDFPFKNVLEWYDYQNKLVSGLDVAKYVEKPLFCDTVRMSRVIVYQKKQVLHKSVDMCLYGNRIEIKSSSAEYSLPFDKVSTVTVLGRNKLNVYIGDDIYQFKGTKRFSALKYVNIFHRYNSSLKGEVNEFLGL